jgi:hypothetical protein
VIITEKGSDNLNTVNIKKLQDTYAKIDEYKAKYRIFQRAYGWHFGGLQSQDWKINNLDVLDISEDGYLKLSSNSSLTKTNPFDFMGGNKEKYKWFSIAFLNTENISGSMEITIYYGQNSVTQEINVTKLQKDYLVQFSVNNADISNISINFTGDNGSIYIRYIKFDKEAIVDIDGIINIYDDSVIYKFLSLNKDLSEKLISDNITQMYNQIISKPTDNGCATCDINTCTCDQSAYGYSRCTTDGCSSYDPCSCNATCHLQERNYCVCDQAFYDKNTKKKSAGIPQDGKPINLLYCTTPELENLEISNDSINKHFNDNTNVQFRKKDHKKPGYIRYKFGRNYKLEKPNINMLNGECEIEFGSEAGNNYTDLWTQLVADIKKDDFIGYSTWDNNDNISKHIFAKMICFNGNPYMIAWYPGGKNWSTNQYSYQYRFYHKLYKVILSNNRYNLKEVLPSVMKEGSMLTAILPSPERVNIARSGAFSSPVNSPVLKNSISSM